MMGKEVNFGGHKKTIYCDLTCLEVYLNFDHAGHGDSFKQALTHVAAQTVLVSRLDLVALYYNNMLNKESE